MRLAVLLAACLAAAGARAESPEAPPVACPGASETGQRQMLGLWHATFQGMPQGATLLLERHPELADSVRGAINRDGERAQVAGDVDDGEFTLEESVDGLRIDATWTGTVIDGSCGREIRGDWQRTTERIPHAFVLRKLP